MPLFSALIFLYKDLLFQSS
uniref:Uncharacterized protein n=1 Tax=Arundo donax TaxID=35708 RepID=A0A0A8Y2P4_ARUDO